VSVAALAACDTKAGQELRTLAHVDSLRRDSLVSIKNELLNEVMTSTQFVSDGTIRSTIREHHAGNVTHQ